MTLSATAPPQSSADSATLVNVTLILGRRNVNYCVQDVSTSHTHTRTSIEHFINLTVACRRHRQRKGPPRRPPRSAPCAAPDGPPRGAALDLHENQGAYTFGRVIARRLPLPLNSILVPLRKASTVAVDLS